MQRKAVIVFLLIVLTAIGGTSLAQDPTPQDDKDLVIGPYEYPDNINSLTGLPYPDDAARDRRNLIVKISNYPAVVRPQYGLSAADLVLEYEAEGGTTRFAAIYRSQSPGRVGSVRSARLIDIELVNMFQALLAYSGSNEWMRQYILKADWKWRALSTQFRNYQCPTFCRIPRDGLAYEHTLFADTDGLWAAAEEVGVNQGMLVQGLAFAEEPDPDGDTASEISVDWFHPDIYTLWQYNPADQRYYRWDSGLPHVDAATGEQLAVDNLVVLEMWHVDRPDVYSGVAGVVIEHQFWGYARAFVFRDGKSYQGWWYRNQEYGSVHLRYDYRDRETPIHLKPGQTWFVIVRKFDPYATEGPLFSVTVNEDITVDAAATAAALQAAAATQTAVWAATATQYVEEYGATMTPYPTPTPEPD